VPEVTEADLLMMRAAVDAASLWATVAGLDSADAGGASQVTDAVLGGDSPTGPVGELFTRLLADVTGDRLRRCRHLRPEYPQPAIWLSWLPSRIYCISCAIRLPELSARDDHRCDACGYVGSSLRHATTLITGSRLPQRAGKPVEWRPPIIARASVCVRCAELSGAPPR
jgi:hypothetical protein